MFHGDLFYLWTLDKSMGEKAQEREIRKENIEYRKEERELGGFLLLLPISKFLFSLFPIPFPLFSFLILNAIWTSNISWEINMSPNRFKGRAQEVKPFRLAKYFAITSFIVFLASSIPFAVFISKKANDDLILNYQNYAQEVSENINHQLLINFYIPVQIEYETIRLSLKPQMDLLDKVVRKATESLNVDIVNIYSPEEGIIVYSTDPSLIRKRTEKTEGYLKALKGEMSVQLISDGNNLWGLGTGILGGQKKVKTYIPLIGEEMIIQGIVELVLDMSQQYNSIIKRQYTNFGVFALILVVIFVSMLLIVRKAEKIIESRAVEQRRLVEQLNLAERLAALGEMVAGVSHEIKNPLGIIQSTSELLNNMPNASATHKKLSGVISEEAIRLNRIVTEFLDFARPHKLNIREFDLKEVISKNIEFLMPEIEIKGISVENNLDGRSYMIEADQDLLHRVMMNLIINAIQAISGAGRIVFNIAEEKGRYNIEIKDTGSGISEENMKKIFNPFFTTKQKGSGLGLPIVRKIIEGHGGQIDIESTEGNGTSVMIRLLKRLR
jgi:two-component system, NtrC family, sensor histidine kinase HydH